MTRGETERWEKPAVLRNEADDSDTVLCQDAFSGRWRPLSDPYWDDCVIAVKFRTAEATDDAMERIVERVAEAPCILDPGNTCSARFIPVDMERKHPECAEAAFKAWLEEQESVLLEPLGKFECQSPARHESHGPHHRCYRLASLAAAYAIAALVSALEEGV